MGGCIESEQNLSQEGDCWVANEAQVRGDAQVGGHAWLVGDIWVGGDAEIKNGTIC